MKSLEKRIEAIEARNKRVEADKAWETSTTRFILVIIVTYITVVLFFLAIHTERPLINALVPCIGFALSTLTVSSIKRRYIAKRLR